MAIRLILAAGAASLALAACGSAEEEKPRKGKYQPEFELTELDFPGMTDEIKEQARESLQISFASQVGAARCIRSSQGEDWKEAASDLSKGLGGTCETTRDEGTDTTADLQVKCTDTRMGEEVIVNMKGAAESESFSMDVDFELGNIPGTNGQSGKMGMKISAKRVGDC